MGRLGIGLFAFGFLFSGTAYCQAPIQPVSSRSWEFQEGESDEGSAPTVQNPPGGQGSDSGSPPVNSGVDGNISELQWQNDLQRMEQFATANANNPDYLIYVEYNGVNYPLKGWVMVPQIANGEIQRRPIDSSQKDAIEDELKRLSFQANEVDGDFQKLMAERQNVIDSLKGDIQSIEKQSATQLLNHMQKAKGPQAIQLQKLYQLNTVQIPTMARMQEERKQRLSERIIELNLMLTQGERVFTPRPVKGQGGPVFSNSVETLSFGEDPGGLPGGNPVAPADIIRDVDARIVSSRGADFVRPQFAIPAPVNSNDLFHSPLLGALESRMGKERMLTNSTLGESFDNLKPFSKVEISPSFGMAYDTRGRNSLEKLKELGTTRTAADGQLSFIGNDKKIEDNIVPLNMLLDLQLMDVNVPGFSALDEQQVQFFVEAENTTARNRVGFRHLYARIWNKENISIAGGKTQSLFGSSGLLPSSLSYGTNLIGTGEMGTQNPLQLRIQNTSGEDFDDNSITRWGIAIEDPNIAGEFDAAVTANNNALLFRWPSITGQVKVVGDNGINTFQLAGMTRSLGMQINASGVEQFGQAWGLSGQWIHNLVNRTDFQSSLVSWFGGGKGVGRYINGVDVAAGFDGNSLALLHGYGGYAGYTQRWINQHGWVCTSNMAYGFSDLDTRGFLAAATNKQLHQAFVNLYVKPNDHVQVGMEWQYGRRETLGQGIGENHRFFVGLQLTTNPTTEENSSKKVKVRQFNDVELSDANLLDIQGINSNRASRQGL